ncbi:hypothetical protein [Dysgonomonas reticulitermitis]
MNSIFENRLSQYSPTTKEEKDNATHEVMQQIALAGLIFRNALSRRDSTLLTDKANTYKSKSRRDDT